MAQSTKHPLFSTINLEREIEEEFETGRRFAKRSRRISHRLPCTRQLFDARLCRASGGGHRDRKLSAEAVVREYEFAAKEIETMGLELIERVKQCENMTRDALAVIDEMKGTRRATARSQAHLLEIEDCSLVTAEVRKVCNELIEKIAGPATAQKPKKVKSAPPSDSAS